MAKKVIRLTEDELKQLIKEATARVMNEMDVATYSRIHKASHRAMQDIQNGNYERSVNGKKIVDNDDIISRADSIEQKAQALWLKDYVGQTFKFFGRSQMGLPAHVLFTFERVTKLEPNKIESAVISILLYGREIKTKWLSRTCNLANRRRKKCKRKDVVVQITEKY